MTGLWGQDKWYALINTGWTGDNSKHVCFYHILVNDDDNHDYFHPDGYFCWVLAISFNVSAVIINLQ